jgi:hypothetical protein
MGGRQPRSGTPRCGYAGSLIGLAVVAPTGYGAAVSRRSMGAERTKLLVEWSARTERARVPDQIDMDTSDESEDVSLLHTCSMSIGPRGRQALPTMWEPFGIRGQTAAI